MGYSEGDRWPSLEGSGIDGCKVQEIYPGRPDEGLRKLLAYPYSMFT